MTVFLSSPVLPVPLSRSVCVSVGRLPAWLSHLCRSVLVFLSLIVCLFATDRQTDRLTQTPTHRHTDRQTDSKHRQKAYVRTDVYTQAVLTVSSEHTPSGNMSQTICGCQLFRSSNAEPATIVACTPSTCMPATTNFPKSPWSWRQRLYVINTPPTASPTSPGAHHFEW